MQKTFWCKFQILGVGSVETLHNRNAEMRKTHFGASFGYREFEVSKHFTIGMLKCQNAKMKKTPFGAGFRCWELECQNTSPQECRNVEMPKCEMEK
jgi:hypothetical protein